MCWVWVDVCALIRLIGQVTSQDPIRIVVISRWTAIGGFHTTGVARSQPYLKKVSDAIGPPKPLRSGWLLKGCVLAYAPILAS